MTRTSVRTALLAVALAASGCAGAVKNMRELPPDAPPPAPSAGKALIVFMRPSGMAYAIQSSVFEVKDGQPQMIGIVTAKAKVGWQVDPGKHLFMVVGESGDFMSADVVAGKTYYATIDPRMGAWKARFSLRAVPKAELGSPQFEGWLKGCRWVAADESTAAWAQSNAPSVLAKYNEYHPRWMEKAPADRPALLPDDSM